MYRIVAELMELSGWVATDAGQHALAQRYLLAALHAAQAAGDREHGAYILALLGFNASLAGQHREAVTIFESAQVGLRNAASLTVQAIVGGFEARACAAAGDRAGFEETLSRAASRYDRTQPGDAPGWAYWMPDSVDLAETGRALTTVGRPRQAIEALTPKVEAMADYPRDVVLTQAYLAEAHTAAGNLDKAAAYAAQARDGLAAGVRSPRTAAVLAGITP